MLCISWKRFGTIFPDLKLSFDDIPENKEYSLIIFAQKALTKFHLDSLIVDDTIAVHTFGNFCTFIWGNHRQLQKIVKIFLENLIRNRSLNHVITFLILSELLPSFQN